MIVNHFKQSPSKRNFMLYLPAAVSDFYIPLANLATHKIQSRQYGEGKKAF